MVDLQVESVYPVSPTQEGMLFHELYEEESRVYFQQLTYVFRGPVDGDALRRAWQLATDRHAVLRTVFVWERQKKPLQVVRQGFRVAWREEDWRGRPGADGEEAFEAFLRADRQAGFEPSKVPPVRFSLIRRSEDVHCFVWSFHHLLLDGWSLALLSAETFESYAAFQRGEEPKLRPVRPYREYIQWLQKQDPSRAEAFWREWLAGLSKATRIRDSGTAAEGRDAERFQTIHAPLAETTTARLTALARRHRLTLSTLVEGVWALLLSRLSGEDDVVFGAAFSGRPPDLPGVESMVGLFIGTIPVRVRVPRNETFLSWVRRLQAAQSELQEHQHTPLVEIQSWSDVPRGLPLFESLFVFESYPVERSPGRGDAGIEIIGIRHWAHTNYPLHLRVAPADELHFSLTHDRDCVGPAAARELLEQMLTLLGQVASRPEEPLDAYSLLTASSPPLLPDPTLGLPVEEFDPVTASFEAWAARSETHVALAQGARSLGYPALRERSRAVAGALLARGLQRGDVVALDGEASFGLIAALLGVLYAGGAVMMLERRLPIVRRRLMFAGAAARWLVRVLDARGESEDLGASSGCDVDGPTGSLLGSAPTGPTDLPRLEGQDAAYVFFTSGTTGLPKGVLGTHRGLSHFVTWQRDHFGIGPGDRASHLTSLSFDVVMREIFLPLTSGATLCLPEEPGELGADRILPWLAKDRITILHTVPSLARSWLAEPARAVSLPDLRRVFFAGEPLPGSLVQRWRETLSAHGVVVNLYRPTETTLAKCFYEVPAEPGEDIQPVGHPLPGTQALVLAENGRLCGIGEWGEIVLRTPYRTRGYLNASEDDRKRFAKNPFRNDDQDLVYHTGDRGRHAASGLLEIHGRFDDQVKVRGVRVEPGEIEAVLRQHPAVKLAAVLGKDDGQGGKRLVAYVVPEGAKGLSAGVVRTFLRTKLPEYLVPSAFAFLPALPLTANGKLDRAALPEPPTGDPEALELRTTPRSPVEEELAGIWREVLGVETVGVHDDFFQLGGHSLRATQVMSRVRSVFRVELPIRRLYEAPTVAGLADAVEKELGGGAAAAADIPPVLPGAPLPLSFAQQRLWFLDQLAPDSSAYTIAAAVRLQGTLDPRALEGALRGILQRHAVLRTTFEMDGAGPLQRVHAAEGSILRRFDLAEGSAESRLAEAVRLAAEEAEQPFDLAQGPLFRATLLRLGGDDHVLLLSFHHAVSDAWSLGVFTRELEVLYRAQRAGREAGLAELSIQYGDYARWQHDWLRGDILERQLSYWKHRLAGPLPVLALPTDHPRPPVPTFRGARETIVVPKALREELLALGRREGATLFTILLGAWNTLLYRYGGQDDLLVGVPIAGRGRTELEGLIGLFVNTLVLRTDLSGDPTFRELLARVRQGALEAYAHPDLPFERLVEELQPERELSRNPLVQVMLNLFNAPASPFRLEGLETSLLPVEGNKSRFDLSLSVLDTREGFMAGLEYSTDLFEAETARRMLGHFRTLLEAVAANPQRRLSELPILTTKERNAVLRDWNETVRERPRGACVHLLFEEQAERAPERLAVASVGGELTYGELNRRANQLAHHLRSLGVGPEVRVGICADRSPEMLVGQLAVLKAGGAYVPLDPGHPAKRLAFMLGDARVPVLLTQERFRPTLPSIAAHVLCLDSPREWGGRERDANLADDVEPSNLAYVIYTSGSTGRPKGVEITHAGLANLVAWHQRAYELTPQDRATVVAAPGFDASVWEIWPYLAAGASLHVPDEETRGAPARLVEWLVREGVTLSFLPTPLAEAVLGEEWPVDGALRALLTGGDKLHRRSCRATPFLLVNHYGPTEGTVVATSAAVPVPGSGSADPPIGRPIDNVRTYVLDRRLNPVPIGVPGELYVGGVGLARGYLDRPALTAEVFVPDPFGVDPGGRLYRTGDQVRYLPNGDLEFLGRTDQQLKIRGFRVEPGEIEHALGRHPSVKACIVAVRDEGDERRLVAYVVAFPGGSSPASELRQFLQQKLPSHMIPAAFVHLDALPLSPNGKVDTRALPAPDQASLERDGRFMAPRTPIEEGLAEIWSDILRVDGIGIRDDFFGLGGHSLLATRVISQVRRSFEVEVPLRALFEAPTIEGLARVIEATRRGGSAQPAPPMRPALGAGDPPLSFAQQRLWFLEQLEPGGAAYNVTAGVRLYGPLDVAALEWSFREIWRRHRALRTVFVTVEGSPVQRVLPAESFALRVLESRGIPEPERAAEATRLVAEEARRPFDLTQGPLFRCSLGRLGDEDHLLILAMHHIVADGWSVGVLLRELEVLYAAFLKGEPSPLPELELQYTDFAQWQREWLEGEVLERQLSYWKGRLGDGVPALDLPTDHPRPAEPTYRGAHCHFHWSRELCDGLKALGRSQGVTLFMTLLAALQAVLGRHAGQDDVAVGSPIANRNRGENEGLIGFFANTLVMRTNLSGDPTFAELLDRVKEVALGAYAHQDLPFEKLVDALQPERAANRSPFFQVMLVLQNTPQAFPVLPSLRLEGVPLETGTSKFDLLLSLREGPHGLSGALEYSTDLFEEPTVVRLLRSLETFLKAAVQAPERRLSELPLQGEEDRRRLLLEWNATEREGLGGGTVHALFEREAERQPEALAAVDGSREMTYGELETRSNRIAHHLLDLGVRPDECVGICVERSLEMLTGVLGILKAGAAYLPLDPAYPRERLAFMLQDSRARVLLGQRDLLAIFPAEGLTVVELAEDQDALGRRPATRPELCTAGDGLAYVIYTSGSTGTPKGVAMRHGVLRSLMAWQQTRSAVGRGGRTAQLTALSFDVSFQEMFATWCAGGTLVLVPEGLRREPAALWELMRQQRVERLFLPFVALQQLADAAEDASGMALREVITAGEQLRITPGIGRLFEGLPGCTLSNQYGPSETHVVTEHVLSGAVAGWARLPPIGRPVWNTRVYVLDARLEPVPLGVRGDLYLGGDCLARGYLNRADLTADRFVPDPFASVAGGRLYRTGDLARWRADGDLEFLGRLDHQVKLRGYRVELAEVEAALARHPSVREVVATVRAEAAEDQRLVAYVVSAVPGLTTKELRDFARQTLPEFMVPSSIVLLESLPLTPSGKVDRKALPAPDRGRGEAEAGYVGPRTPVEHELARIWAESLGLERVGVHDDFFQLGGHSLLATRVMARLRDALGVALPLRALFECRTISALANRLEEAHWLVDDRATVGAGAGRETGKI